MMKYRFVFIILLAAFWGLGCKESKQASRFEKIPAAQTQIAFKNELPEDKNFNIINYLYYYNGGGVAVGDINKDGLQDLYFTSNIGSNKLYLNKGNFQFEDITAKAGVAFRNANWKTGVTMVDLNADGWLDIYVSCLSGLEGRVGKNALFINNKNNTFTDRAAEFGLAEEGYGQQASFFDYDRDGDLDVYLLRTSVHSENNYRPADVRNTRDPKSGDKLLRNDNGKFTDVSEAAGIYGGGIGYGLGIATGDLDNNGYPDLYIANDFHEDDYLYFNNGDGTFTERIKSAMPHTSQYSMGVDIADFNNDGLLDVMSLDMMPDDEHIRKASEGADRVDVYRIKREYGYHHQLARNALQLNQGKGHFSDIAPYANVFATDWSWGVLFADLDLDGNKDIFVSNGIYRRPNDLDFLFYISNESIQRVVTPQNMEISRRMPQVKIPNYAFRNTGALKFDNVSKDWGLDDLAYSNGSAYADLDNDGDLDLITNCINEEAGVYKNTTMEKDAPKYLAVELKGASPNTQGLGARILVYANGQTQTQEMNPTRGWLSSVAPRLHFGLGKATQADSVTVVWANGKYQTLKSVKANQILAFNQADATHTWVQSSQVEAWQFEDVTASAGVNYIHKENEYTDFNREFLIPKMVSREGPALAIGDVNGDGNQDFYVGGASGMTKKLMLGQSGGRFSLSNQAVFVADSLYEDVDAVFFDADQDKDLDLIVGSGGGRALKEQPEAQSRLYLNDGKGNFARAQIGFPNITGNAGSVTVQDIDGDGDQDVFIGMRSEVSNYGAKPRSYLLENQGGGTFKDITDQKAPELAHIGMVTEAAWTDLNQDQKPELVLVGDWMPMVVFERKGERWEKMKTTGLKNTAGWWNALHAADLDGDGDQDLVAGNLGENSIFNTTLPLRLYLKDVDKNGSAEPIMTYMRNDEEYTTDRLDDLFQQLPMLKQRYEASFTKASQDPFGKMFNAQDREGMAKQEATLLSSVIVWNQGKGQFKVEALPAAAQFSTVYSIQVADFNGDSNPDILLGGNFNGVKPAIGRYDASYGVLLQGDGKGKFSTIPNHRINLWLDGEIRALRWLPASKPTLLVARSNGAMQVLTTTKPVR